MKYQLNRRNRSQQLTDSRAGETARALPALLLSFACAAAFTLSASQASAQGVLTVTPGATAGTVAGTGVAGYSGDNGPAASAAFASPSAVAYDAGGNLYIADSNNNVVRRVTPSGTVTTVAGTGQQGFAGDGGPATSAWLDTPTGIAVDAQGNLFIADSHNNRIREVSAGVITTVAGNGSAGFSGDGGAATSASLDGPAAVAVDASGNLYIADTDNDRIREVSGGNIQTIAGNGMQGFSGDGGSATSASLDSPTGVAVDASGDVFIADRHNQRIREVSGGAISTVAGGAATGFSGGFSGDGGSATAAALARPSGVAIDAAGNLYIADTDNQRLREVGNGSITTIAGSGAQGYGGDSGAATAALLNQPRDAAVTPSGNVAVADALNQRVRSVNLPSIVFPGQAVGIASTSQPITLANSGSGTLVVQTIAFTGSFQLASGGSCSAVPITLGSGSSCTQNIEFLPTEAGSSTGSVVIGGSGVVPQALLLSGSATQTTGIPVLTSSLNPSVYGAAVTFTATMPAADTPTPTGTIVFYDGATSLASVSLSSGVASYQTSSLAPGSHSITAAYSGDAAWQAGTSTALLQVVNQAAPAILLATSASTLLLDNPVTFTATISGAVAPTGTVSFYDGTTLLGSSPLAAGVASFTTASLSTGTHTITAAYSGDSNFTSLTSSAVTENVEDFTLDLASGVTSATVTPGGTAVLHLVLSPVDGTTFPSAITLSASGLPSGAVATFSPSTIPAGSGSTSVTLTLAVPSSTAALRHEKQGPSPTWLAFVLLPFAWPMRRAARRLSRTLAVLALIAAAGGAIAGLTGCGSGTGYFGEQPQTYSVSITATSGSLSHSATLTLKVE